MKIGMIKFYEVEDSDRPAHGDYLDMFRRLCLSGGLAADWRVYEARDGELPQAADECDGYLLTGSRCGIYESHAWISPLLECIRVLHAAHRPLLGICFGHQAVAQALGGHVEKSERGWGAGRQTWQLCGDRPWLRPPLDELRLLASHQDQVVKLPPQADLLARSDFCPYAMYAIESHVFCMQGHPEFMPVYMRQILTKRQDQIPPAVWQQAMETAEMPNDRDICAQWIAGFFAHNNGGAGNL